MGLAGFLRKLQEFHAKHKVISTIFSCLLVIPPAYFYSFYATTHLSNVLLTKNSEDAKTNNFLGATLYYISFITQVEGFAVVGISMFSLLATLLLIIASERKIDPEAKLSIKSFILTMTKPARSLFVTWFFVRLFKLGFIFLALLLFNDHHLTFIDNFSCDEQHELSVLIQSIGFGTIIFVAGGILIFAYLATFGNMALDISVREDVSGTKALEKASQVLKGKWKIIGFVVNVALGVISFGLFVCYVYLNTSCSKLSAESKKSIMRDLWNFGIYPVEFYTWTFFSILYSTWKKISGETISFQPQGSFKRIMQEEEPLLGH